MENTTWADDAGHGGHDISTTAVPLIKVYQQTPALDGYILLGFKIALIIAILLGNGMVLIVYFKFPKIRAQPYNVFIIALAMTDFMTGLLTIPMDIFKNVSPSFFSPNITVPWYYTNKELCLFGLYVVIQPLQWSTTTLVLIGLDRLVATFFPLRYYVIISRKKAVAAIVISWIVSSIPLYTAIAMAEHETYDPNQRCTTGRQFHPIIEKTIFYFWSAIPIIICVLTYSLIWIRLCRHRKQVESQKRHTLTMTLVMTAFTICLLPLFVVMHRPTGLSREGFFAFVHVAIFLAHFNSFVNVLIYNAFNPTFRKCFKRLCCPRQDQIAIHKSSSDPRNGDIVWHTNTAV